MTAEGADSFERSLRAVLEQQKPPEPAQNDDSGAQIQPAADSDDKLSGNSDDFVEIDDAPASQEADDDVEVEGDEPKAQKSDDSVEKKRVRPTKKQRVAEYARELEAVTARQRQLEQAYLAEKQARELAEQRARDIDARTSETILAQHKEVARGQLENARERLLKAKESGDTAAEMKAIEEMTQAQAYQIKLAEIEANRKRDVPTQPASQPQPQQQAPVDPNAHIAMENQRAWLEENSWARPDSEDYSPEARQDVERFAAALVQRYAQQGRVPYSMAFFKEIDAYVEKEWLEQEEKPRASRPATTASATPTAPVTRGGELATGNQTQRKVLTRDQAATADKFPSLYHPKTGKLVTSQAEKRDAYWHALQANKK